MRRRARVGSAVVTLVATAVVAAAQAGPAAASEASSGALTTSNPASSCATRKAAAVPVNITDAGITMRVLPWDETRATSVTVTIQFWDDTASSPLQTYVAPPQSPDQPVVATLMQGAALQSGQHYKWRAGIASRSGGDVEWSRFCWLRQDSTPPAAPAVSSTDYPSDSYAGSPGKGGVFTFAAGAAADTDVVGYRYGVDTPQPVATVRAASGVASVVVVPASAGPHDLFVQAVDAAGNVSPATPYHFLVAQATPPVGYWKFDETSGTTATGTVEADPNATGPVATLTGGAAFTSSGERDGGVALDGTTAMVDTGSAGHLDTAMPFAVTVWVRLSGTAATQVVASADGERTSAFTLAYRAELGRWVASMPAADDAAAPVDEAVSTSTPQAGVWTHLAVVYDHSSLSLFVDGVNEASVPHATAWPAAGSVVVGRGQVDGAPARFLAGTVDELRLYDRALVADASGTNEVTTIYRASKATTPTGAWDFEETSGTTAADSSGNGHPLTLAPGATFTATGHAGGGLALDGASGTAATAAPVLRTDGSYTVAAWVRVDAAAVPATVLGQDGSNVSGVQLRYEPDFFGGYWVFSVAGSDSATAPVTTISLPAQDPGSGWAHITAGYDATKGTIWLRVSDSFGVSQSEVPVTSAPWQAAGGLRVGAAMARDSSGAVVLSNFLTGAVDQVRTFDTVLTEAQRSALDAT